MPGADQMQHQILRRGRAACGHAVAVNHKPIWPDVNLGMCCGQIFQILPMHCCAIPFQKPRPRHHPWRCIHPPHQRKTRGHAA